MFGPRIRRGLKVGLLGGSFNPAHDGHRHISLLGLRRLKLDQVWWLVSPQNPLNPTGGMANLADRLASARQAARHPRIRVSDLESRLGTRYTVDTVKRLKARYPGVTFVWLMGADNLAQISHWRRWTEIFQTLPIAIFDRHPYAFRALAGLASHRYKMQRIKATALAARRPPAWGFVRGPVHPASATALRAARKK